MREDSAYPAIFWAGMTCGVLDGISATVVSWLFGGTPIRLFQGIASGLLGRSAFQEGVPSALLGVGLHFLVAFGAATVYYTVSRSFPVVIDHALLCGIAYGAAVHVFMTFESCASPRDPRCDSAPSVGRSRIPHSHEER
jgi:hypothetical protein